MSVTCLLAAALIALSGCGEADRAGDPDRATTKTEAAAAVESPRRERVDPDARTVSYDGEDGKTALELLEDHGYDVEVEEAKLGAYVTAIGDVASTGSRYWTFTVDGKMPAVGAGEYETKDGQRIEWRFGS